MSNKLMKSIQTTVFVLMAVTVALPANADTSVWKVTKEDRELYLGGTVHLLREADYPLPLEYDEAYGKSSRIVFETDLAAMSDLSVQAALLRELTYQDERTLKTVLNDEAYAALEAYTQGVGLPLMMMEKFKPGMIVTTLQIMEFQKIGFTPQGVDAHFNARGLADGKTIGELESIEDQIGFLAAMGEGSESEFILLSLEDLAETAESMNAMITAWREGDNSALAQLFVDEMRNEAPEVYESLLKQRNYNWMPQIEAMLETDDIEFVLVGAAHLVGPDGLLELLEAKGFTVEQL